MGSKNGEVSMSVVFYWPEMSTKIGVKVKLILFCKRKCRSSVANTFILFLLLATCFGFCGENINRQLRNITYYYCYYYYYLLQFSFHSVAVVLAPVTNMNKLHK